MKRIVKALLTLIGLALIALGVGAVLLYGPIGDKCKAHLEENLTKAMGSKTTLEGVSFVPWRQEVVVRGLAVANPDGFKEGIAMRFDRVVVTVDASTILSATPVIDSAILEGGHILLRYEVGHGTNLQQLAENAAQAPDSASGNEGSPGSESPSGNEGSRGFFEMPKKFVVNELSVKEAEVELSTNLIPLSSVQLDLVSFTLEDVSQDKPVSAADLTVVLLRSLLKEVVTLKGILAPVAEALGNEISGWFDGEQKPKSGNSLPNNQP